jgi:hypothetical protein
MKNLLDLRNPIVITNKYINKKYDINKVEKRLFINLFKIILNNSFKKDFFNSDKIINPILVISKETYSETILLVNQNLLKKLELSEIEIKKDEINRIQKIETEKNVIKINKIEEKVVIEKNEELINNNVIIKIDPLKTKAKILEIKAKKNNHNIISLENKKIEEHIESNIKDLKIEEKNINNDNINKSFYKKIEEKIESNIKEKIEETDFLIKAEEICFDNNLNIKKKYKKNAAILLLELIQKEKSGKDFLDYFSSLYKRKEINLTIFLNNISSFFYENKMLIDISNSLDTKDFLDSLKAKKYI